MSQFTPRIDALTHQARPEVLAAIRQASATTGVDFAYLLEKAAAESGFDPQAQASTSSARGLYQFVDRTWLDTLDKHGAEHGLHAISNAITRDAAGNPVVSNASYQQQILALRDNPRISALMAAELAQDNKAELEQELGREVGNADLYMAHFLGANGAAKFLTRMEQSPELEAAHIVPAAARANQNVFYANGRALALDEVYERFAGKFADTLSPTSNSSAATLPQERLLMSLHDDGPTARQAAARIAAGDPNLAALHLLVNSAPPAQPTARQADLAMQLFTLTMMQALDAPGMDERPDPNDWFV
jgi:hypothetical protein